MPKTGSGAEGRGFKSLRPDHLKSTTYISDSSQVTPTVGEIVGITLNNRAAGPLVDLQLSLRVEEFDRAPLRLQPHVAVMLKHLTAQMAANSLNSCVRCLCLCQG